MITLIAIALIMLHGPGGQPIEINVHNISSLRVPRGTEHFARDTHCLVFMSDGKFIAIVETCAEIVAMVDAAKRPKRSP